MNVKILKRYDKAIHSSPNELMTERRLEYRIVGVCGSQVIGDAGVRMHL